MKNSFIGKAFSTLISISLTPCWSLASSATSAAEGAHEAAPLLHIKTPHLKWAERSLKELPGRIPTPDAIMAHHYKGHPGLDQSDALLERAGLTPIGQIMAAYQQQEPAAGLEDGRQALADLQMAMDQALKFKIESIPEPAPSQPQIGLISKTNEKAARVEHGAASSKSARQSSWRDTLFVGTAVGLMAATLWHGRLPPAQPQTAPADRSVSTPAVPRDEVDFTTKSNPFFGVKGARYSHYRRFVFYNDGYIYGVSKSGEEVQITRAASLEKFLKGLKNTQSAKPGKKRRPTPAQSR
ncbi:MAG: hypothetical protein HY921_11835 [Elusimicrobia bacterium]|nr:hypothetical protein [Elusimicrobiota bacterium]